MERGGERGQRSGIRIIQHVKVEMPVVRKQVNASRSLPESLLVNMRV